MMPDLQALAGNYRAPIRQAGVISLGFGSWAAMPGVFHAKREFNNKTRLSKLMDMKSPTGILLYEFLERVGASRRAIHATHAAGISLDVYFSNKEDFEQRLLRISNIGRKSCAEILDAVEKGIKAGILNEFVGAFARGGANQAEPSHAGALPAETQLQLPQFGSLEEHVNALYVGKLSERSREVISLRGAIFGSDAKTLDEIGALQGVTRERIRQIEKNAKRVISSELAPHRQAIVDAWLDFFPADRFGFSVTSSEIRSLWTETPTYLRLALFCLDIIPGKIVDQQFFAYGSGWLLDEKVRAIAEKIEQLLSKRSLDALPTPITHLIHEAEGSVEELSAILRVHERFQEYRGYLIKRPAYRRIRRMADLHQLLSRTRDAGPRPLSGLLREYLAVQSGMPCSTRDALVVMADQGKGLFLNCYEYGWYPLPPYPGDQPASATRFPRGMDGTEADTDSIDLEDSAEDVGDSAYEALTIEDQLEEILAEGPLPFDEVRDAFLQKQHSWSPSSVGPVLISSSKFQRVAPGVYALAATAKDSKTIERGESILCSDKHCKLYCQARWAGEDSNLYPYWGTAMELRWATMLAERKDEMLFSSLMAVVSVDEWPVSEERKAYWRQRKVSAAKYLLEESPGEIDLYSYTTRQVVAAAVQAANEGRTSWMACNRASGKRVDDRHACSLLAILWRLGVIEGAKHWQVTHKITNQAVAIVERMLEMLARQPDIPLKQFVSELGALPCPARRDSWLESAKIKQDIDALSGQPCNVPERLGTATQDKLPLSDISAQILSMRRQRRI